MCEYCKYCSVDGGESYCTFFQREPTYKEYKECKEYQLHDILQKQYDEIYVNEPKL